MIRSSRYKFVFVHIPKTAGSSVTSALLPYSDPLPLRWLSSPLRKIGFPVNLGPIPLNSHATCSEILDLFGSSFFDYFRFAFVRNPYDWVASTYYYILKDSRHVRHRIVSSYSDINEFVAKDIMAHHYPSQSSYVYSNDGTLLVNKIACFENLNEDFNYITSQLNLKISLPETNRTNKPSPCSVLSRESLFAIKQFYEIDFLNFGYS